jgi:hypothetical protein
MGLTTDAMGVFRPFWADSRTGTFQIRTAMVRVEVAHGTGEKGKESRPAEKADQPKVKSDVTDQIDFVFDPTRFGASEMELELPVRLKNISRHAIYGPITVKIDGFGSGMGEMEKEFSPTILNATNGKPQDGATFEYSQALGSEGVLAPSGVSGEIVWRLKLVNRKRVPDMHFSVEGFVPANQ